MTRAEIEQAIRAGRRICRGARTPEGTAAVNAALAAGDQTSAAQLDAQHRTPCGADVNELILAAPLDGQEHEAPCPHCGTVIHWRAPVLETDADPAGAA